MDANIKKNQENNLQAWTKFTTSDSSVDVERGLHLESIANSRQLGGLSMQDGRKIRENKLLRTAHLGNASDNDVACLHDIYHLSLIIDLRSAAEHATIPDRKIPEARELWNDISASQIDQMIKKAPEKNQGEDVSKEQMIQLFATPDLQKFLKNMYIGFVSNENSQKAIGEAIHEILKEEGKTILWHCTQGKDRCGLMSAIMLGLLGADRETIIHDFSLSNVSYTNLIAALKQQMLSANMDQDAIDAMTAGIGVNEKNMTLALDWIDENYGSMNQYITKALGITEDEQSLLKTWYLE